MRINRNAAHRPLQLDSMAGERGLPNVNTPQPIAKRGVVALFLLFALGVTVGAVYYSISRKKPENRPDSQSLVLESSVPHRTFTLPPPAPAPVIAAALVSDQVSNVSLPAPSPVQSGPTASLAVLDKSASSLMTSQEVKVDLKSSDALSQQNTQSHDTSGDLDAPLTATRTPARLASWLGNRNFILPKGAFIDCVLQTKLDTTVPGMTSCMVTRNIYSDNGKVVLIERGSTVSGEYQANLKQGMKRIFVLWNRIKTPNGVTIQLDSPGTDRLGGAGLPGYVNTHFWQRFGGALMLSLVDDVAQAAVQSMNARSNGNTTISFGNTTQASQNMAAEVLRNTINIPPTLYKNQGESVGIYVARDLDFSSVYDVAIAP